MLKKSLIADFEYEKCDSNLIEGLSNYLDVNSKKVLDYFGLDNVKTFIKIYSSKAQYDLEMGSKFFSDGVPKWVIGNLNSDDNSIHYVSFNDYVNTSHVKDSLEDFYQTLLHEYVHFVTNVYCCKRNISYPSKYISEGIAYYLSGQGENRNINWISDIKIDDIRGENHYINWYLIVRYIIEVKGKDYFFKLLENKDLSEKIIFDLLDEVNSYEKNKIKVH